MHINLTNPNWKKNVLEKIDKQVNITNNCISNCKLCKLFSFYFTSINQKLNLLDLCCNYQIYIDPKC